METFSQEINCFIRFKFKTEKTSPFLFWCVQKKILYTLLHTLHNKKNTRLLTVNISKYLNTAWIWFLEPIVATNEPLHKFGYKVGSCPIAEEIGKGIINLPINLEEKHLEDLLNKLTKEI